MITSYAMHEITDETNIGQEIIYIVIKEISKTTYHFYFACVCGRGGSGGGDVT